MDKEAIFISHIAEEASVASRLKSLLIEAFGKGEKVFLSSDYVSIESGDPWFNRILTALKASSVVVVVISRSSEESPWINFEAGVGKGVDALVVPVLISSLQKSEVRPPMSQLQLRSLQDRRDVEAFLHEIGKRIGQEPEFGTVDRFMEEIRAVEMALPYKGLTLIPSLHRLDDGYQIRFSLANTGNRELEPVDVEVLAPKAILSPTWVLTADEHFITGEDVVLAGHLKYFRMRYKDYPGPGRPDKPHVDALPSVMAAGTTRDLKPPFALPIKANLGGTEPSMEILWTVHALGMPLSKGFTSLNYLWFATKGFGLP